MTSKSGAKKKDTTKNTSVSQFLRSTDADINAELEAMAGLEYNLHNDFDAGERLPDAPLFPVRKARSANPKKSSKHDEQLSASAEKSSTKNDKFDTKNQVQTYTPNASVDELQAVVRQAASTAEDKYRILDARDRLMRTKQSKSQHLSMSKVTRGICPDMCPEKERLMRESQRQVAAYELQEGGDYKINHETAVKQYSRSSADQEEPMPQDLRPVKALKMTMSYLLHEIADLCEDSGTNLAEWYHFLWDRTRGIRKDITQQELCCHESVELVEQCARFHIVCAERLGAEEVSVFDKKINTENLTKCLQTLKYMYQDLRVNGIECKNEPEFRAYIILLNLNNGNFMWDVQRLPPSVQKSPEVRFAIEVYSSIESNNYAKFFRLVRDTTYLNACILLRYFNQVRLKALSIMVKAYCRTAANAAPTAYPLYELIDILGFEDESDAVYFSEQVGLKVSNDDLHIMLNRNKFSLPESNIEQGRACNIVESKRISKQHTIGQCIAGEKLPEKLYEGHKPHDSFDAQGYLKPESLNAEDQNTERIEKPNDPYEYMEEDISEIPQIFRSQPEPKKSTSNAESFETKVSYENKQKSSENIFKIPTTVNQSNFFQSSPFAKPVPVSTSSKKADKVAPFFSKPIVEKTQERGRKNKAVFGEANAETKTPEFDRSAPLKRSREENDSPFSQATPSIFGNASGVTNIFAKPTPKAAKTFGDRLGVTKKPSVAIPTGTSIFGTAPQKNVFGNVASTISNFSTPSYDNKISSKTKTESWPSDEPSIFQTSQQQREPSITKSQEEAAIRERQEFERKQELEKRRQEEERKEMMQRIERETEHNKLSEKIVDELLNEIINEDCENILDQEIYVERKLEELSRRTRNRIILKYLKIWRQYAFKKKQQRSALDVTPVWLQQRSVEECAKSLYHKEQEVAIKNMRQKRFKPSNEDSQLEFLQPIESKIYAGIKENAKALDIEVSPNLFWKIIISWPHLESRPVLWRLKKIMNQYICPSDYTMEPIIKSYKPNSYETLHICIKHFEGLISEYHLAGSDGLFFIATSTENPTYVVRRLTSTILSRQKLMPIPVIVVILGEENVAPQKIRLNEELNALLESGYVSEYTIHYEETVDERIILKLIQSATLWLTMNKSPPIPLEMDYLSRIVDTCLTEELWHRILGHSSFNKYLESALEDVKFVIDLHNEAVTHLIDIVLDPEALMYTDFPPEFKIFVKKDTNLPCSYEYFDAAWKNDDYRGKLEREMNNLLLPKWTFDWPINDTLELHNCVVRYCKQALGNSNYDSISCSILGNVLLMPRTACKTSFIQVLLEILKEKIRLLKPDARVVYNKNHIRHFRNLPWWFKSSTLTSYIENASRTIATIVQPERTMVVDDSYDLDESDNEMEEIIKNYDSIHEEEIPASSLRHETQRQASEFRRIAETLEKSLTEQKSRSRLLEEKLMAALNDNESISVP